MSDSLFSTQCRFWGCSHKTDAESTTASSNNGKVVEPADVEKKSVPANASKKSKGSKPDLKEATKKPDPSGKNDSQYTWDDVSELMVDFDLTQDEAKQVLYDLFGPDPNKPAASTCEKGVPTAKGKAKAKAKGKAKATPKPPAAAPEATPAPEEPNPASEKDVAPPPPEPPRKRLRKKGSDKDCKQTWGF